MGKECWRFPSNNFGEFRGFNDSGVEHFTDNISSSLAREICQNSLDAAINEDSCVNIEFRLFEISPDQIPGKDELLDAFERLSDYWSIMKDPKAKTICNEAKRILNDSSCQVLRISDFNTTGLSSIKETDRLSPWYNLVKFTGASDKAADAGGSFGMGKYSSFACSALRTVFYSTCNTKGEMAFQGVSRLASFIDANNEPTQGIGYYGGEQNTPVFSQFKLDNTFIRDSNTYGTDIYILGYKCNLETWKHEIIGSVIDGFFYAIHTNKLSVNIDGEIVNSFNLTNKIKLYENNESKVLEKITPVYYNALITAEQNNLFFKKPLMNLGTLNIWVIAKEEESGKKSIAMIRKTGMKIYDDTHCTGNLNVAGICYIEGLELNNQLKALENPAHTAWSTNRAQNPKQAKKLISTIKDTIRNILIGRFSHSELESVDAMGMGVFLPDEESGNTTFKKKIILSNEIENIKRRKKRIKKQEISTQLATEGNEEDYKIGSEDEKTFSQDAEGDTYLPNGNHGIDGNNRRMGSQNPYGEEIKKVNKVYKATTLNMFLPICVDMRKGLYSILIKPSRDTEDSKISLFISAETDKYPITILQARLIAGTGNIEVNENNIQGIIFKKSETIRLMVELDYTEACSLEVEAYAS